MVILENGTSFEFIHNFPSVGPAAVEKLLSEWVECSTQHTATSLAQFVKQWRNRRKWMVLKNKHFFDCFVIPVADGQIKEVIADRRLQGEWWLQRF
jgi:hypothetical protein